jgi:pyridoxal phosphate enzyme (YggS family)
MAFPGLPARVAEIRERIRFHQARGGWTHPVRIIAVTKSHGPEAVRAAVEAGLVDVGENRVQEALEKQDALRDVAAARWHLIGTLQRNKVRHVLGRFVLLHAVDRPELVVELDRRLAAAQAPTRQAVLVEVNCSGEAAKGGVAPGELGALLDRIAASPRLELKGLMTMAALSDDPAVQRAAFGRLRELRDTMRRAGHELAELSMGMSGDYPVAVEEGATMVRLGTLLFGERPL